MAACNKILLLDDDEDLLELYREILSRLPSKPQIYTVPSGARAIALLESAPALAQRFQSHRDAHRLHRPGTRPIQDVRPHRAGSLVDGLETLAATPLPPLAGEEIRLTFSARQLFFPPPQRPLALFRFGGEQFFRAPAA